MPVRTVAYLGGDMTESPAARRRYHLLSALRGRTSLLVLALAALLVAFGSSLAGGSVTRAATPAAKPQAASLPTSRATLSPAVPSHISSASPAGLDAFVRTHMRIAHVPGLAACVVRGGDIVWAKGYGWANIAQRRRVTPDTDFMLASVSKTVMATALMQLVQQGRVDLQTDVDTYLPFRVRNPQHPGRSITPWMLLTHTSSIRDAWATLDASYVPGDSPVSLASFVRSYFTPGSRYWRPGDFYDFAPGGAYRYANMGATLAGYLVQRVAHKGFDRVCQRNIFRPLGMNATSWHLSGLDPATVAMPYKYVRSTGRYQPYGQYGYPDYPDGELRTSVSQLGRFLAAYMNGGSYQGVRILKSVTVAEMLRPQIFPLAKGQGLIWYHDKIGSLKVVGHNGGDSGVSTFMFFDPASGAGAIVLTNGDAWRNGEYRALQRVVGKLLAPAPQM
jgi:CubicO group peptidase (beta-lactamase class C family)